MDRRRFLAATAAAGFAAGSCTSPKITESRAELFRFIHFSDIHVQPEQGATEGFLASIEAMNALRPDFCVGGGDLIMDALAVDEDRAYRLYDLYDRCCQSFTVPVHHVMGNHEVFGITVPDKVPSNHPDWGKELFKRRLGDGATYRSFDHKGVHLVLLDTVGIEKNPDNAAHRYIGQIGEEQLAWLEGDLAACAPDTPIVMIGHIPLFSLYEQITNGMTVPWGRSSVITDSKRLHALMAEHHVLGLLQGHIHVNELYRYKDISFIDTGAVCGGWWAGPRDGHPEGFNLVRVYTDGIEAEYHTYGWDASVHAT